MKKLTIIYWSGTGNTAEMADLIAEGFNSGGGDTNIVAVENATKEMVADTKYLALGCPSMGAEILEEELMQPFVDSLEDIDFSNKIVALFGSYDWGDGEWMRNWEDQMKGFGAKLIDSGLTVNLTPEADSAKQCINLGVNLANTN
jgi:flavodoxin I